jgi:hypothetical protein
MSTPPLYVGLDVGGTTMMAGIADPKNRQGAKSAKIKERGSGKNPQIFGLFSIFSWRCFFLALLTPWRFILLEPLKRKGPFNVSTEITLLR